MIKFAIGIAIAIIGANVLANAIDLTPATASNLDRAHTIEQIAAQ